MRQVSERLEQILDGSFSVRYVASIARGDRELTGLDVLVESCSWDASADVEAEASLRVLRVDPDGESFAPQSMDDLFAPFGSEVTLSVEFSAGSMSETLQVGVYRLVAVPRIERDVQVLLGEWRTVSEVVELVLEDRMSAVVADRFTGAAVVRNRQSAWAELDWLTAFPTVESVPDRAVPANTLYEREREDAVQKIAGVLGGVAHFDEDGALTVRVAATEVSQTLRLASGSSVVSIDAEMDSGTVYNGVVVTGKRQDSDGTEFSREVWVSQGPLDPSGPFGRKPYFFSSDFIYTNAQADAEAQRLLGIVSTLRGRQVTVTCVLDPRTQLGDLVRVIDRDVEHVIRVTSIAWGQGTMRIAGVTQ